MPKCPVCKSPVKMGKSCKPKDNPTRGKINNSYCTRCGWSDKNKEE